jgi:oxygen-independent coproporphyrinogen III oxidase
MADYLYIHVPFCVRKCIYCDFFSLPYDEPAVRRYVDALCRELSLKKNLADILKTIYIGGGTPTLLPAECFGQIFRCFDENYSFSSRIEITVEANPGTVDKAKIDTLLSLGSNRLSLGVQSFNDNELMTLGRIHSSDEAVRSIESIIRAGLKNFSIDLMYGIPGQSMESWMESLTKATELSPSHISAYELTLEENTPLFKLIKSGNPPFLTKGGKEGFLNKMNMLDEDLILEMYNHAIDYLAGRGYEHYEISNFARPGFQCLHNLNYWDRGEYIGAGAGAHSFARNVRSVNTTDISEYIARLEGGHTPGIQSTRLSPDDALKEFIFLGLRKTEGISLHTISHMNGHKHSLRERLVYASQEMIDNGYLELTQDFLRFTRKGVVVSNTVIVKIFGKLGAVD